MSRILTLCLLFMLLFFGELRAQDIIYSPGFRIGFCFAEKTQLDVGVEMSAVFFSERTPYTGVVLDLDLLNFKRLRLHAGFEELLIDVGPSVYFGGSKVEPAIDFSAFIPLASAGPYTSVLYLQYTYSWLLHTNDVHLFGATYKTYSPRYQVPFAVE